MQYRLTPVLNQSDDPARSPDLAASRLNLLRVGCGDLQIVDDPGLGHVQRFDAGGVGLDLLQPLRADHLNSFKAVGDAAAVELFEPRQLFLGGRHDDLATDFIGH